MHGSEDIKSTIRTNSAIIEASEALSNACSNVVEKTVSANISAGSDFLSSKNVGDLVKINEKFLHSYLKNNLSELLNISSKLIALNNQLFSNIANTTQTIH